MGLRNDAWGYGSVARLFHWTAAVCVASAWLLGTFIDDLPKAWESKVLFTDISCGLAVLALLLCRGGWRRISPPPPQIATPFEPWVGYAALVGHYSLYLLMLAVPLVGITLQFTRGKALPLFGLVEIASPWVSDRALASSVKGVHGFLAVALVILAAGHVVAALLHHYALKDDTLRRMLMGRRV